MDQAFNAWLQLNKGTVVGDVGDATGELGLDWVLGFDAFPWISLKLLHAQRDTMALVVDANDLDLDGLADREHFRWVVHTTPCDVGDMEQAVNAAQINKRTVIGDVLDHAVDNLALFELLHDFRTLFGARLFEDGTTRHDDIAATLVHLQDLEWLWHVHQGSDIADGANIDLRTGQERNGAFEVDGETALDLVEDGAFNALIVGVHDFELDPALFTTGLFTAQNGFASGVLDAVNIDLDDRANNDQAITASSTKFLERNTTFGLQTDVDDRQVFFDRNDGAFDNGAFKRLVINERVHQQRFKIFFRHSLLCQISSPFAPVVGG